MSNSYSSSLRLTLQRTGENAGTWGDVTNNNLGILLEQAIAGVQSITITGNITLSTNNGLSDQARNAAIVFIGTLASNAVVTFPSVPKLYAISNSTTGGYSLTLGTSSSSGTTVMVPNGVTVFVVCDGTNVTDINALYTPSITGTVAREVSDKLQERISVKDFGADATGTLDATSAFSLCAQSGSAIYNEDNASGLPYAPVCVRYIPAGTYKLTSLINTNSRYVIWIAQGEVRLITATGTSANNYLNGKLVKEGQVIGNSHFSFRDYACGFGVRCNNSMLLDSQVDGFGSASDLNTYYSRDSVGFYVSNQTPACLIDVATASYTATTVTLTLPSPYSDTLLKLRAGMVIDTKHTPIKYSGIIQSWSVVGAVITITVTGWYISPASGANAGAKTPTGTAGCIVSPVTKIWGQNTVVQLQPLDSSSNFATSSVGFELGLVNKQSNNAIAWGYDSVNLSSGYYAGQYAFVARNDWQFGYRFNGLTNNGLCSAGNFVVGNRYLIQTPGTISFTTIGASTGAVGEVFTATGTGSAGIGTARQIYGAGQFNIGTSYTIATTGASGFTSIGATDNNQNTTFTATGTGASVTGYAYANSPIASAFKFAGDGNLLNGEDAQGNLFYQITANGSVEMGNKNLPNTITLDLNSSGLNADFDARITASGGSATTGQGTLSHYADNIVLAGVSGASVVNNTNIKLLTNEVFTGGTIHPLTNNSINLGTTALRWANIYSVTALNVSSDQRLKQDISVLSDAEKRVAIRLKSLIRKYRFISDVQAKGDSARIHVGVIAQDVQSAFTAEGLDGFKYGLLCYDEWTATNNQPAGNTYGIRYEELLAFIIAGL